MLWGLTCDLSVVSGGPLPHCCTTSHDLMQLKWACCCALLRFLQDAATLQRIPCSRLCAPARTPPGGRTLNKSIDFKEARLLLASTRVFSIFTPLHHHPPLPQPPLPPSAIFLWGRRGGPERSHGQTAPASLGPAGL